MRIHPTTSRMMYKAVKSPFVWRSDWGFAQVKPEPAVFQRYGICGDCEVPCRDGMTKIRDLTSKAKIITRGHGFVSAVGLIRNDCSAISEETQLRVGIPAGSLGGGLPQNAIVVGAQSKVSRYISTAKSRRLSAVSVDLDDVTGLNFLKDCPSGDLFVPVFREAVEISIEGVYVSCPTILNVRTTVGPVS
ncbi:hypothetical protein SAMN05444287_0105 [Octadecabacter temperatus]|uniref:Uncharacterized protein n=1 Tax=Octadecabacter temperatus TaxID=1458307 RepID=A0A0K0Y254_9RHOB|nr:hypothetical protein [Octadecabacter temperatus]AKS45018.1 hypothetical protein OSB_04540 [Octadecabacter temperatus]SIN84562.1 hypothetical protein SAMN05444287_0105 [Octadecabacter temperatus]